MPKWMRLATLLFIPVMLAGITIQLLYSFLSPRDRESFGPIVVGANVWTGYEPLWLARDLNFLGSRVHLMESTSATQVMSGFLNHTIDVAALTLDEALTLPRLGVDYQIILILDISDGADALLASAEIESIKALQGKKVGVEDTAVGALLLAESLQAGGLAMSDVRIKRVLANDHEKMFLSGEVDAIATFDPVRLRLVKSGAKTLFDSSMIKGTIVDVLVAHRFTIENRSQELQELLTAWFQATRYLRDHPEDAYPRMSKRLKLSADDVRECCGVVRFPDYEENLQLLETDKEEFLNRVSKIAKAMKDNDLLSNEIRLERIVDSRPLQGVRLP